MERFAVRVSILADPLAESILPLGWGAALGTLTIWAPIEGGWGPPWHLHTFIGAGEEGINPPRKGQEGASRAKNTAGGK